MKLNRYIFLPAAACLLALGGCEEHMMEWGRPEDQKGVTLADIPLDLQEKIANYRSIRSYAEEYASHMTVGLGIGAEYYMGSETVKRLSDENFQMFTTGNAMKHSSVVNGSGELDFTTVDAFLNAIPADMKVYGHNFIWHTQQRQNYLRSLIAPKMVVVSDSDVANILVGDNSDFNGGTTGGWGSWGSNKESQSVDPEGGPDGSACMVLVNKGDGNAWEAQCAYTMDLPLEAGKLYVIRFKARSNSVAGSLQFQYQNGTTYGSQGGYNEFAVGTGWTDCEYEFSTEFTDVDRIILNFGKVGGTYYVDDIEFGLKVEEPMENIMFGDDSDFEGGTKGKWGSWGNSSTSGVSAQGEGCESDYAMVLTNPSDGSDYYVAQAGYDLAEPLEVGKTYILQFDGRATVAGSGVQFAVQNTSDYSGEGYHAIELGTDWMAVEHEYTCTKEGMNRILISFGKFTGSYYIDNVKFGVKRGATPEAQRASAVTRAGGVSYEIKSPEEKRTALLGAMESWIKGMAEHVGTRVVAWDVINEPIADGSNRPRGIDNTFGSSDSDGNPDRAPEESTETGLALNWASDHFYWGYYLGMEYATKAFEYARRYCGPDAKLFVNEYNLETSPGKLAALIDFVKYIDEHNATGAPIVDGIGTQMHVVCDITREQVDEMFRTMAATGKLVRVTELDVRIGYEATPNPSAGQLELQANVYRMIFDSYRENVPVEQQSGITIWGLSDHADEHTYWYPGDTPNIFDANYARKHAYKGVCDGIAGRDLSEEFSGEDWEAAYPPTPESEE